MKIKLIFIILSMILLSSCNIAVIPQDEDTVSLESSSEIGSMDSSVASEDIALPIEEQVKDFKYQPPKEVLDTHFYSTDIVAKIEFDNPLSDFSWENFDNDCIEKLNNEFYKHYPKEIVDDINKSIVPQVDGELDPIFDEDLKIISM